LFANTQRRDFRAGLPDYAKDVDFETGRTHCKTHFSDGQKKPRLFKFKDKSLYKKELSSALT